MRAAQSIPEFRGAMTALVTPFKNGEIDWPRVEELVDRQVESGIGWLVPCGTTGESPTLTEHEHQKLVSTVIARAAGRCGVLAGTGTNSTATTVRRTKQAALAGANAALIVTPYYNRPSPEGLYRHYAAVAESVDLPLVLYNVPFRTGVSISNDVVVRLRRDFSHIAAIKHATGSVEGVTDLLNRCDIIVLSGDDALTLPLMSLGATGVISVVSNLAPSLVRCLTEAVLGGDYPAALSYHRKLHDLAVRLGRCGPNPLPIKAAMALCGLIEEEFRLPLCPVDAETRTEISRALQRHELLETTGEPLPV